MININIYEDSDRSVNVDFEHNGCKFRIKIIDKDMKARLYKYRDCEYAFCYESFYSNEDYEQIIKSIIYEATRKQHGLDN